MTGHEPRDRASIWYLGPRLAWAAIAIPALAIAAALVEWLVRGGS